MPDLAIITRNPDLVGECPVWDAEQRVLFWTDNRSNRIYRYVPLTGVVDTVLDGVAAYAFTLQRDGSFLLFLNGTRVGLARDGAISTIIDGLPGEEGTRFNDVLVDSQGRVLCGVLPTEDGNSGSLYLLTQEAPPVKFHSGMKLPNGLALSINEKILYVADTYAKHILAFDYEIASGTATSPRIFLDFSDNDGAPDGITVDTDDCLWVASPGSWGISRYSPGAVRLQHIALPARRPTSVGFGGDDMRTLFITSSSRQSTAMEDLGLEGGALFACSPLVAGVVSHRTNWCT